MQFLPVRSMAGPLKSVTKLQAGYTGPRQWQLRVFIMDVGWLILYVMWKDDESGNKVLANAEMRVMLGLKRIWPILDYSSSFAI